ncbi:MAG: phosphosulfolactate synthase [Nitrososphaeraceae archaeon]|nr:phosphosulfolactate synthase [Nitrososphaeraceae archaeon]MDW0134383.1 phosphosulfolactate synthase [Nitrososphaeraceae archaeon]MDW0154833.1 phosphosulfolactate synthase [Nitrososphaeraceae archaeon]
MLDDLFKGRVDGKKPRQEGLTLTVDKLESFDRENFEILAAFIDQIKIYNTYPLLISNNLLQKRISYYHNFDIKVSTGSTLTEYAISENSLEKYIKECAKMGFDIIEIGENNIDIDIDKKKKISNSILSADLTFNWKIGKKDPRHQIGIDNTLLRIEDVIKVGAKKVILEANEGVSVGIYDQNGSVIWNYVAALTAKYPPNTFIFEAPLPTQQSALIAEFGQRVNLAEINIDSVASVESQRRGFLSKSSFGMSFSQKEIGGGPASKFIYYLIKTRNPIEQGDLIGITHLPRRTVQSAIEDLKNQGFIIERNSLDDSRRKVYYPVKSEWL